MDFGSLIEIARLPHLLISGVSGAGKSTLLRDALTSLVARSDPTEFRLFLYSSKAREYSRFEGLPHVVAPPTCDATAAAAFLVWASHEMDRRYARLAAAGVRNLVDFNLPPPMMHLLGSPDGTGRPLWPTMPRLVVVLDGLEGLKHAWATGALDPAIDLCHMSRAVGIHLLMVTSDLCVTALPSHLLVNVPARLSFREASRFDSIVALRAPGAEDLGQPGQVLFMAPGARTATLLHTR